MYYTSEGIKKGFHNCVAFLLHWKPEENPWETVPANWAAVWNVIYYDKVMPMVAHDLSKVA